MSNSRSSEYGYFVCESCLTEQPSNRPACANCGKPFDGEFDSAPLSPVAESTPPHDGDRRAKRRQSAIVDAAILLLFVVGMGTVVGLLSDSNSSNARERLVLTTVMIIVTGVVVAIIVIFAVTFATIFAGRAKQGNSGSCTKCGYSYDTSDGDYCPRCLVGPRPSGVIEEGDMACLNETPSGKLDHPDNQLLDINEDNLTGTAKIDQPDVVAICPNCMAPCPPFTEFCKKCTTPVGNHATIDPFKQIFSIGWMLRRVVSGRLPLIAIVGLWLILTPVMFANAIGLTQWIRHALWDSGFGGFLSALVGVLITGLHFVILYLSTSNFIRHRRRRRASCLKCGYSLPDLTEPRCPECGTTFDLEVVQRHL